jgi:hypothetical protein
VNVYVTMLPTTRLAHPFFQFECHCFTMAIFGVVQIGIIFSSLVVDPLPDKSVTFVSSEQNQQKLD